MNEIFKAIQHFEKRQDGPASILPLKQAAFELVELHHQRAQEKNINQTAWDSAVKKFEDALTVVTTAAPNLRPLIESHTPVQIAIKVIAPSVVESPEE